MSRRPLRWDVQVEKVDDGFHVRSLFGTFAPLALDRPTGRALGLVLSGASDDQVVATLRREDHVESDVDVDVDVDVDNLRALRQLGQRLALLEGPKAAAERARVFAAAVSDGALHLPASLTASADAPAEIAATRARLDAWLDDAVAHAHRDARRAAPRDGRLVGGLSPHGALVRTGDLAARLYAHLDVDTWPDVFVVVGTSHHDPRPSVLTLDVQTTLGRVAVDRDVAADCLQALPARARADSPAFLIDHSVLVDLDLLIARGAQLGRTPRVVLVLAGDLGVDEAVSFAARLESSLFERRVRAVLIASGDLTHLGVGHAWRPPFSVQGTALAALDAALDAFEGPARASLLARDVGGYAAAAAQTSFCARAQVAVLQRFALDDGRWLGARTVLLSAPPADALPARDFADDDVVFRAGVAAFFAGDGAPDRGTRPDSPEDAAAPAAPVVVVVADREGPLRLCPEVLVRRGRAHLDLLHRCSDGSARVPVEAAPVVAALFAGADNLLELARAAGRRLGDDVEVDGDDLAAFCASLRAHGVLAGEACDTAARAQRTLDEARATVPAYGDHPAQLAMAPILRADDVRARWDEHLAVGVTGRAARSGRGFLRRTSSGSSGRPPLLSVVERDVAVARGNIACFITGDLQVGARVMVNRPSNLFDDRRRDAPGLLVGKLEGTARLGVTPGPNPTTVDDDVWDRALARVIAHEPVTLHGDATYLAGLARRALVHGTRLPALRVVELGHGFASRLHRAVIARAFPVLQRRMYHSSELGLIGVDCALGAMHLAEARLHIELVDDRGVDVGRAVDVGGVGDLVATTLDTKVRPLVRYAQGDRVRFVAARCRCGRPGRVIEVLGRAADVVRPGDGRALTLADLDAALGVPDGVGYAQFRVRSGRRGDALSLAVVPTGARALVDARAIGAALARALAWPKRSIAVAVVDDLRVPARGKLPPIVHVR